MNNLMKVREFMSENIDKLEAEGLTDDSVVEKADKAKKLLVENANLLLNIVKNPNLKEEDINLLAKFLKKDIIELALSSGFMVLAANAVVKQGDSDDKIK